MNKLAYVLVVSLSLNQASPQATQGIPPGAANSWQGVLKESSTEVPVPTPEQLIERGKYSDDLTGVVTTIDDTSGSYVYGHSGSGEVSEELPTNISDAIVVAKFADYQTFISPKRKSVYTTIAFTVSQALKNPKSSPVSAGSTITIFYPGGTVRNKSGKVVSPRTDVMDYAVRPGRQYLLFLQYDIAGNFYTIFKSWEFTKGIAKPNSRTDRDRDLNHLSKVAGKDQATVLSAVKVALASPNYR